MPPSLQSSATDGPHWHAPTAFANGSDLKRLSNATRKMRPWLKYEIDNASRAARNRDAGSRSGALGTGDRNYRQWDALPCRFRSGSGAPRRRRLPEGNDSLRRTCERIANCLHDAPACRSHGGITGADPDNLDDGAEAAA